MIELKISQGAKPGHGGILPGKKVTPEIARIRDVPVGKTVNSPPGHSAFSTPVELLEFIQQLRELSGGKPVGFKIALGKRREFMSVCKAMLKTGIKPDFIAVDGGEGGTGAAPIEFSDHLGAPGIDSLIFVNNALKGFGLRKDIKIISSGKIATGFGIVKRMCLGADMCYSARAMMMALGCIQALRCNANDCPNWCCHNQSIFSRWTGSKRQNSKSRQLSQRDSRECCPHDWSHGRLTSRRAQAMADLSAGEHHRNP